MRIFNRNPTESRRIEENSRCDKVKQARKTTLRSHQGDLNCEEAIIKDKERFDRVRKSMMINLRNDYGRQVADRALWRVNRRRTEGYLKRDLM